MARVRNFCGPWEIPAGLAKSGEAKQQRNENARTAGSLRLQNVGEAVAMKSQAIKGILLVGALLAGAALGGCGGGSSSANTVTVSIQLAFNVLVPKQSETLTALVSGATNVSADFSCTYSTTADPTTATPNPTPVDKGACSGANGAVGTLSNVTNTSTTTASTATFTAPDAFPDQKTLPNVIVTITATAHADTKKTGTTTIRFDSGVRLSLIPTTATLAVGETKQFNAQDLNGNSLGSDQVTWGVTFETTAKIDSVSCTAPTGNDCGSVDATGKYTAPAKVPTAAPASTTAPVNAAGIITIFVFSKVDSARIAQGSVTIVAGGTVTFNGLSPINVPFGGPAADIFLNAPNVTSQIGVIVTSPGGSSETIDNTSNKIKIVFAPAGTSSIGARIRLGPLDLKVPGTYTVQITAAGTAVPGSFTFNVLRVAPSVIATSPDNFQQKTLGQTSQDVPGLPSFSLDGGYFGAQTAPAVGPPILNNNNNSGLLNFQITPRAIFGFLPPPGPPSPAAGLFSMSVTNSSGVPPLTANTNVAIIPDYGGSNPPGASATTALSSATSAPSSIAIDPILGVGAVTLAGINDPGGANTNTRQNVQFFSLTGAGIATLGTATSGGNIATSIAIDQQLHIAAIVNYASRNLAVISLPSGTPVATVDLSKVIPPPNAQPFPYAVGIDPFLHRALVAFADTNVGLIVNLDATATPNCILSAATTPYCATGYVTLNTGDHPQVAFEPNSHIAYVTPGGGGLLEGINLATSPSTISTVTNVKRTANSVQVTTKDPHNLASGVSQLGGPTVLISNVPAGANGTNFNGAFPVTNVLGQNIFTYAQADKDDSADCTAADSTPMPCLSTPGVVNLVFSVSPSMQGVAVNPITHHLGFADPNVTSSQIEFLDPLSNSFTAMTVFKDAVGPTFSGSPEIGETAVAFQPFSNTAVVLNPNAGPTQTTSQISLVDPSLLERAAIVNTGHTGSGSVSFTFVPPPAAPAPATVTVKIPGAIAVDPVTNLAVAANSGDGTLTTVGLGQIKSVHIQELRTPDVPGTTLRSAALTQPTGQTIPPLTTLAGVKIFGTGFTNTSQVRLDGTPLASGVTFVNGNELDVNIAIPPALVGKPHRFAVDIVTGGVFSNVVDLTILQEIDIPDCGTVAAPVHAAPGGVAIDEQRNLAVVTNTACHQVSLVGLDTGNIGQILGIIQTGATPTGVAVLPRLSATLGLAVVTNFDSGSVSILDLDKQKQAVSDLAVGSKPSGVAINQQTNLAIIANFGSNSINAVDLTPLSLTPAGTLTVLGPVGVDQNPIAVAIDPDRGTSNRGLAVVSAIQLSGTSATGVLDAIDIGAATPIRSTSAASGLFLNTTPTGLIFDPFATSSSTNPGLFYSVASESNQALAFNPDNGGTRTIPVGINPTSLAININSGTLMTVNAVSNTTSLVDTQTLQTKQTIGIGGAGKFAAAIHNNLNLGVIVDQANNRVLLLPLP
jgi:hypothetical protein